MGQFTEMFENMYRMDYEFGWLDKDGLKGVVEKGYLTPEGYQRITGDAYVKEATPNA